jgi:sortase A
MLQAITAAFRRRLSNVFLLFGLMLVAIGVGLQASREAMLAWVSAASPPPSFESSVARAAVGAEAPIAQPHPPQRSAVPASRDGPARELAAPTPVVDLEPRRLVVPAIGLDTGVVTVGWEARAVDGVDQGSVWQIASHAAGFHLDSAPPGRGGNTVLSGHNNIEGSVFRHLHELEPFDWIYLFAGGRRFAYLVEENFVVAEAQASPEQRVENLRWIGTTPDERLTLVSCYPPWSNTHRTIVLARPIVDEADLPADAPPLLDALLPPGRDGS